MTTYAYGGSPTGLAGKYHYGSGALGILGSYFPSTGTHGPSYMQPQLEPADLTEEVYGLITSIPPGVTLKADELGRIEGTGSDGTYIIPFDTYKKGVYQLSTYFSMTFGELTQLYGATLRFNNTMSGGEITVTPPAAGTFNTVGSTLEMLGLMSGGQISITPGADVRYARPASTVTPGAWVPSSGSDLAAMLDEPTADSSDYISTVSTEPCEIALNPVIDPGTSSGQVVRYQAWSPNGSGIIVRLKQGTDIIASWVHDVLPASPTIFAQSLTTLQCDSITNYSDLRIEFEGS
jgi:hypothetical protein